MGLVAFCLLYFVVHLMEDILFLVLNVVNINFSFFFSLLKRKVLYDNVATISYSYKWPKIGRLLPRHVNPLREPIC